MLTARVTSPAALSSLPHLYTVYALFLLHVKVADHSVTDMTLKAVITHLETLESQVLAPRLREILHSKEVWLHSYIELSYLVLNDKYLNYI